MSLHRGFNRLHRRKDILRVYANGERVRGVSFDLIAMRGNEGQLRVAVVVPLLGRNAVERNRVRRRTKEVLRTSDFAASVGGDVIVRAKAGAYEREYQEILDELKSLFSELAQR